VVNKPNDPMENQAPERENNGEEHIVEPENALPEMTMTDLPAPLREAAGRVGWTTLMPVQAKAIPYIMARRDLMIQSRTGSGKTGAFILPIPGACTHP